ncbi:MAG: metallophosphoesterase [Candidatus Bathyarchaeota archaeon]|nr:metallophosphoesterase [Candidatus Bathyarchaeota archaeon]
MIYGQNGAKEPKKKRTSKGFFLVIGLIVVLLIPTFAQPLVSAADSSADDFSIIWITDTQYLSAYSHRHYDNLCQWIAQNTDAYNVKMVIHTGDIVNDEGNRTQWDAANQSMSILLNNNIPYTWNAGNHDYNSTFWIGNQYAAFNPQLLQTKQYWVSDVFDGLNTAVRFNISDWDFLIVNIAFEANDTVLMWANNLLDANPEAHAIVATHAYLNKVSEYDGWAAHLKETVLDRHANVFLTLSGHYHPTSGVRVRVGERDELLFNQQDAANQMGANCARILTFDLDQRTVKVQTFSILNGQFKEDANNSFTLNTSFGTGGTNNVFSIIAATVVVAIVLVAGSVFVYHKRCG